MSQVSTNSNLLPLILKRKRSRRNYLPLTAEYDEEIPDAEEFVEISRKGHSRHCRIAEIVQLLSRLEDNGKARVERFPGEEVLDGFNGHVRSRHLGFGLGLAD